MRKRKIGSLKTNVLLKAIQRKVYCIEILFFFLHAGNLEMLFTNCKFFFLLRYDSI